ncbi:hypothetical protein NC652_040412 [Populus alba x Populus x berolinensis]|nr:hypothetical protein NC652_040412 [Populus alba x Populus x berolinensis]
MWNGNSIISRAAKNKETCILSKFLKVQSKGKYIVLYLFSKPLASSNNPLEIRTF